MTLTVKKNDFVQMCNLFRSNLSFNFLQQGCKVFMNRQNMDELGDYLRLRHVPEEDIQRMEQGKVVIIGNAQFWQITHKN